MSKAVLTLDEINLLLYSEEPKNKKLYGNLYDILNEIKPTKALTDEQFKLFDDVAISALTYNKKSLINTVIQEWYTERVTEEDPSKKIKCGLCNTPNKYLYFISNRLNNNILNVGSSCITKFPGIEGYVEQKQQLSNIIKNQKIVARRNEFHKYFPNVEDIISECEKFKNSIPIALPLEIQENLDNTIERLRKIYNMYVESGKKPFKSNLNSFEIFEMNINHYKKLKCDIEKYIKRNISHPHICRKREVLWLKNNNKLQILKSIQINNGFYTVGTVGLIYSHNFVYDNLSNILQHKNTHYVKIYDFKKASPYIDISFQKAGYDYPIVGKITLQDFMKNIGSKCIFDNQYYYSDKDLLSISNIDSSISNIQSILNYIFNMIKKLRCAFLVDHEKNMLVLYRKSDKSIRYLQPKQFVKIYISYILQEDDSIYNFLFRLVRQPSANWISYEDQEKYNTNEKIGKMYVEQYLSII